MLKNIFKITFLVFLVIFFTILTYISTQHPRISFKREQIGLVLWEKGYRSWFLNFSNQHWRLNYFWSRIEFLQTYDKKWYFPKYYNVDLRHFDHAPTYKDFE